MKLICPVCSAPLLPTDDQRQLQCESRHSFDRAKQGYWNLLLAQNKRSKLPGDSDAMVKARQRFLDSGKYRPLSDLLNRQVIIALQSMPTQPHELVDLGCGDGYYTQALATALQSNTMHSTALAGIDISKDAVRAASRRTSDVDWLVASAAKLPVESSSVDLALNLFSRPFPEEICRILRSNGQLIFAYPGSDHLRSLRSLIYDQVVDKPVLPNALLDGRFECCAQDELRFSIDLNGSTEISDLLMMTPHGQRIRSDKRTAIQALSSLKTEAHIFLERYQIRKQSREGSAGDRV